MGRMNEGCLERDEVAAKGDPSKMELKSMKGSVNWKRENGVCG
jgi:hypothetical protein